MDQLEQPIILSEANWKVVNDTSYTVAVLPWGATEAHNYHLPYGTDNFQVEFIARKAAGDALTKGSKILVLPCIPMGINTGQLDVKFCLNILPSTQLAILKDLADVLCRHGIEKLVILNGHGGNNFKNMIRELSYYYPKLFVTWVNWYHIEGWDDYFDDAGDHAGEMETSAMMHIRPDLVRPLHEAGSGHAKKINLPGFKEGWATAQRPWTQVTSDTGVGNPKKSTPEKGERYLRVCYSKLAHFLIELDNTSLDRLYS